MRSVMSGRSVRGRIAVGAAAAGLVAGLLGATAPTAIADPKDKPKNELGVDELGHSDNIALLSNTPKSSAFADSFGTDVAFQGDRAYVGNYNGFTIYDISDPESPTVLSETLCPGSQNDVSIHENLLFLSTDSRRTTDDCSSESSSSGTDYWEGIKIFDVSDPASPQYVESVETDCGSHTHTLVPGADEGTVHLYVSSYGPNAALAGCQPPHDKISVVTVPVADPTQSTVTEINDFFAGGGFAGGKGRSSTSGCHDITAFPSQGIAAGACMGDGVIIDITDPARPAIVETVQDENFAFWHSATFNEDGTKVVFTDELGGGAGAVCDAQAGPTHGADAIYDLGVNPAGGTELTFASYYKIPRYQEKTENCVAHNGSLIPVAGKDIMVQAWYQGGISVWDFTDSANPHEIGYLERGPLDDKDLILGGSWSAYYYNGYIYSSDIQKGLDVIEITDVTSDAAPLAQLNVQTQPDYLP